jgi:UDP-glucose:(heptosyl)LPS alpha-1,3-glucosyltransferase
MVKTVAIIIERADLARGGAERSMSEVVEALSARGLKVDLLAARGESDATNAHVLCGDAPGKRVRFAVFRQALKRHLARANYDITHSVLPFAFADLYQPRGGTYAELMLRNVATYRSPVVRLCKRLTAFTNYRRAALLRAERKLCQGPDGPVIAALSRYVANQLQEHYGTDPRRIVLTLNGVKTDERVDTAAAGRLRMQILAELGFTEAAPPVLFLFVAQDFQRKGLDRLIEALALVGDTATERPARLVVVGADRSDGYRRLARRLGVEQRIVFLGPIQEVQNVLSVCDVGILPTFCDAASRSILEALAAGKPVITTRFNGATDHFTDGRHGRVVDAPENIATLASALTHFSATAHLEQAGRAIRNDRLADRISVRRVADDLVDVYNSILERKRHS